MEWLFLFGPAVVGALSYWFSNRCRGKNAKYFFRYAAWGMWLLYLLAIPGPFTFPLAILNPIIKIAPSVVMFLLAVNSIIREMRSQQQGEYTDAA
jgi:hypothetical protein